MKYSFLLFFVLSLVFPSFAQAAEKAQASIINSQGIKIGQADFKETRKGLKVSLKVSGLTPGVHAMHIHEAGVCQPPDFKTAGPHFNPHGKKHGTQNPEGAHAGDLPNITAGESGKAKVKWTVPGVSLSKGDTVLTPGKASIVIHASADDSVTDPAGNAGDRIACGVIQ